MRSKAIIGAVLGLSAILATSVAVSQTPKKIEVTEASFKCIRDLTPVRGFYVGNLKGDLDATLKVARSENGGVYPPGSIVQLVPTEAMVKHEAGYDPATGDWEYFELAVAPGSTKINVRGSADVKNRFGGNCHTCHAAAEAKWDKICEQTHGCAPIPITPLMSKAIQNTDPRCAAMELPADQQAALKALAAAMGQRPQ